MEKIIIQPESVRGLGNVAEQKEVDDFELYNCILSEDTDVINNVEFVTFVSESAAGELSVLSLSASSASISIGGTSTLTATLTDGEDSPISGATITFKEGSTTLGTDTTNSSGVASYTYTGAVTGSHNLSALFTGDSTYAPSTASTSITVNKLSTSTALSSSGVNVQVGTNVTLTATVTSNSTPVEGLTVTFKDGTATLGTGTTNSSGVATYSTSSLSVATHSITAVTTETDTYSTSTSSAVSVTVYDHLYSLAFSQSSYTATGGSAEISCTLLDNNVPVEGATISFSGSDSSLYSGITNNEGIASVTVTNVTGTVTFTGTYSNVSATCTVTALSYLFYDECTSDRTSEYTTKGSQTITYNSSGYYTIKTTSQSCPNVKINSFTAPNKVKISTDFRVTSGSNAQPKICLFDESKSKGYGLRVTQNNNRWNLQTYTSWTDCGNNLNETTQSVSLNTWYHLELTVDGNDLTGKIYDSGGTLLSTITSTGSLNLSSTGNYVGIGLNYTSNTYMDIKNIKAEAL